MRDVASRWFLLSQIVCICTACCRRQADPIIPTDVDHRTAALMRVNQLRALHGSPPMKLDKKWNKDAEDHAVSVARGFYRDYHWYKTCFDEGQTQQHMDFCKNDYAGRRWIEPGNVPFSAPGWKRTRRLRLGSRKRISGSHDRQGSKELGGEEREVEDNGGCVIKCPLRLCYDYFDTDVADKQAEWNRLTISCVDRHYAEIGGYNFRDQKKTGGYFGRFMLQKQRKLGVGVGLCNITQIRREEASYDPLKWHDTLFQSYYQNAVVFFSAGGESCTSTRGSFVNSSTKPVPQGVKDMVCRWTRGESNAPAAKKLPFPPTPNNRSCVPRNMPYGQVRNAELLF